MRILQVCDYIAPAKDAQGTQRVVEALTIGLKKLGHEVFLMIDPKSQTNIAPVVQDISKDAIDIVHYHGGDPKDFRHDGITKWVRTIHGGGSEPPHSFLHGKDHYICISNFIKQRLNLAAFVHNPIAIDDFIYKEEKDDYFLWLGGTDWGEAKGLFSSIALARNLGIKLKIAGTGQDKDNIDLVKKTCDSRIQYLGPVNGKEKAELLANAKAVLNIGSVQDAFCLVNVEALASGTPVIARDVGAHSEILHEKVAFICKNKKEIAEAVLNIDTIKNSRCRDYAVRNFREEKIAADYLNCYEKMIKEGTLCQLT
jgi:glycosyltransferase involved in cell wall biosynthesis